MRATLRKLLFSDDQQQHHNNHKNNYQIIESSSRARTPTTLTNSDLEQHPARRRDQIRMPAPNDSNTNTTTTITTTEDCHIRRRGTRPVNSSSHIIRLSSPASGIGSIRKTKERRSVRKMNDQYLTRAMGFGLLVALGLVAVVGVAAEDSQQPQKQQIDLRSTQPTLDRQLETPSSSLSSASSSSASSVASSSVKPPTSSGDKSHELPSAPTRGSSSPSTSLANAHHQQAKPQKPAASLASQKKAAALAAQRDYDKYQLKASPSSRSPSATSGAQTTAASSSATTSKPAEKEKEKANSNGANNDGPKSSPEGSSSSSAAASATSPAVGQPAHKKIGQHPNTRQPSSFASSSLSLLKKFLPSFMTSAAGPMAAAAAAAASAAVADKQAAANAAGHSNQHSRSSPSSSSLLAGLLASSSSSASSSGHSGDHAQLSSQGLMGGKIINLLSGAQKKKGLPEGVVSAIPNHAPFFMRKTATDRQAGGGALALASGLLSNPLKLGLLFSAPLLPSLLLTPLAIAGLSPAMSAINNFFGDDDEPAAASSQSPLAAFASGLNSPLASILQATGASPFGSSPASASASSDNSASSSSTSNNFALQAFQSFLTGPTSTTERPLFNPGMFASSGIQSAAGALGSALSGGGSGSSSSTSSSSSGGSSSGSSQQSRPLFGGGAGGGLMQAAASMISPSFAAPPSSSSSNNNEDDGPGLMQMASDVFEKVANYMGTDSKDGQPGANSGIGQASGGNSPNSPANSPLSTLASLSSMSPFQLSSLFASTPLGSALAGSSGRPQQASGSSSSSGSGSSGAGNTQRAGFLSTLRNVYELFSSSFLRRQEVGNENECQQRLVCELHQRAMNSKLFRRSLQSNLAELANLDKNLLEQIKYSSQTLQARVDPDTKAMLSDFLKATNNFKSGREMINCSQMFPKCTRTQLLAAANAHLADPVNGRAIGKFSQLMKKMKFKSNQQHQSQWKLRKPSKSALNGQSARPTPLMASTSVPMDYLQVAPLSAVKPNLNTNGQLTPVDSLKLAQQIMMLSQMSTPQQQQSQQQVSSSPVISQYVPQQQQQQHYNSQQASQSQPLGSYPQAGSYMNQYSPAPMQQKQQTTYTDAIMPSMYNSPTDSPYFMPAQMGGSSQQQQPQQQQYIPSEQQGALMQQQQYSQQQPVMPQQQQPQQQQPQHQQHQQQSQQQYQPASGQIGPSSSQPIIEESMSQQQPIQQQQQQQLTQSSNTDNKNQPQQLMTPKKQIVAA